MRKNICLAVTLISLSCGKSSGNSSSGSPIEVPLGGSEDTGFELDQQKYYTGITDLKGNPISLRKVPSVIEDGIFLEVCKSGQTMHLDECYDEIHLSEKIGFKVKRSDKEVSEYEYLSQDWLNSFSERDRLWDSEISLKHRKNFSCELFCLAPTLYGYELWVSENSNSYRFLKSHFTIQTTFRFGGNRAAPEHFWFLNGTITLKGKTLPLPVTRRQIKEIFPEMAQDRVSTEYGVLGFTWENIIMGYQNVPVNDDDKRLVAINY
jgi:hypothetical protein